MLSNPNQMLHSNVCQPKTKWYSLMCFPYIWNSVLKFFPEAYWSEWEDTSPCSKSCEMGKKNQKRYCERGKQKVNVSACEGKNTRKQNCNTQRCRESKFMFARFNSWERGYQLMGYSYRGDHIRLYHLIIGWHTLESNIWFWVRPH